MRASAAYPAIRPPRTTRAVRPWVFHAGHPVPELRLLRMDAEGPLDRRVFTLAVQASSRDTPGEGAQVEVLLPRRLGGGEVRWQVLGVGRLERHDLARGPGEADRRYRVIDTWAQRLDRSAAEVWAWLDDALVLLPAGGSLLAGDRANRSTQTHRVAGEQVHVLQPGGEPWRLGDAVRTFSVFHGLGLRLPAGLAVWDQPLREDASLSQPAGSVLRRWCETYGLSVSQTLRRAGGRVVTWRSLRPTSMGRRIGLPRAATRDGDEAVRRVASAVTDRRPRRWVARGDRPTIESTFTLSPGWDPSLEGQPDAAYDRGVSSDFSRYANVYRRWVLNEDGRDRGPTFDLAALFAGVLDVPPTAVPFGTCLTRDDAGRRLTPVVEWSLDGGATWSTVDEAWQRLRDRAGAYLDASSLNPAYLAAAKAGAARLRVTATLTATRPIEAARWQGNLFDEPGPQHTLDASALFVVRRVDQLSIHHAGLAAGLRTADERDDRDALARWLLARVDESGPGLGGGVSAELELAGARPELRVGDRLTSVVGAELDAAGTPSSLTRLEASVAAVRCEFEPASTTRLMLHT